MIKGLVHKNSMFYYVLNIFFLYEKLNELPQYETIFYRNEPRKNIRMIK